MSFYDSRKDARARYLIPPDVIELNGSHLHENMTKVDDLNFCYDTFRYTFGAMIRDWLVGDATDSSVVWMLLICSKYCERSKIDSTEIEINSWTVYAESTQ